MGFQSVFEGMRSRVFRRGIGQWECYDNPTERHEEQHEHFRVHRTGCCPTEPEGQRIHGELWLLDHSFMEVGSGRVYPPDVLAIVGHRSFEGMSDPDDMSVLYAIESADGTKGSIVDAFGT